MRRETIGPTYRASRRLRAVAALLVAGIGCSLPTGLCACTYPPTAALQIQGAVTRVGTPASGVPSGVYVQEETFAGGCQPAGTPGIPPSLNVMMRATPVDAQGQYQLTVRILDASATVCVRLTAFAPGQTAGTRQELASIERPNLRLRDSRVGGAPLDTIRVDFALP